MWNQAFLQCSNQVVSALIHKAILPAESAAFERYSAAMVVRAALNARESRNTLAFLVAGATASTARCVAAGLLVGNHAHANGFGELPSLEIGNLLSGDVLFVTAAVTECRSQLETIDLGGQRLSNLWDVVPLSRYTKSQSKRPRIYVANPGWLLAETNARQFAGIIIDATHPRTLNSIKELLSVTVGAFSIRVIIAPPLTQTILSSLGFPGGMDLWLWDLQAKSDAQRAIENRPLGSVIVPQRILWLCDSDPTADKILGSAFECLADTTRRSAGRSYPGLQIAWSIVNRLRQLSVPLTQLNQASINSWSGTLQKKVSSLEEVSGHGDPIWDATWPSLKNSVQSAYNVLLDRRETSKFWALAERVGHLLKNKSTNYRVVVPTSTEGILLTNDLAMLITAFSEAIERGQIEIVTPGEESRRVADGRSAHTLLLGIRSSAMRYMDLLPTHQTEVFLYPFETRIEEAALHKQYRHLEHLTGPMRSDLLVKYGIDEIQEQQSLSSSLSPSTVVRHSNGQAVTLIRESNVNGQFDLDDLITSHDSKDYDNTPLTSLECGASPISGDMVEVSYSGGRRIRYHKEQYVDVFFLEDDQIQREIIASVQKGWRIISFVDGHYDSLFRRMADAIQDRLPKQDRVAIELWQQAKAELINKHVNKKALHTSLVVIGLKSTYETFSSWFREGLEATLAPQQEEEFNILAASTGVYTKPALAKFTFKCVQTLRGRNRTAGRKLQALLRAMVSQQGYVEALESARQFNAELADTFAAVEVLEVQSVKTLARSKDS